MYVCMCVWCMCVCVCVCVYVCVILSLLLLAVCHVDQSTFLVGALKEGKKYNFSMCNPPFYPEDHDLHGSCSHGDRPPACSINTGQPHETATVGGEEVFVQKLIDDSLCLRDQVRWVTC